MGSATADDEYPDDVIPTMAAGTPVPDVATEIATAALTRFADGKPITGAGFANILPILGTIIGALLTGCSAAHITNVMDHIKARPDGLRARLFRRKIAAALPEELGTDREVLAQSVITEGMETYDVPERRAAALAHARP
jgi:hypothetical protein